MKRQLLKYGTSNAVFYRKSSILLITSTQNISLNYISLGN